MDRRTQSGGLAARGKSDAGRKRVFSATLPTGIDRGGGRRELIIVDRLFPQLDLLQVATGPGVQVAAPDGAQVQLMSTSDGGKTSLTVAPSTSAGP